MAQSPAKRSAASGSCACSRRRVRARLSRSAFCASVARGIRHICTSIYVTSQEVFHIFCDLPAGTGPLARTGSYLLRSDRHHRSLRRTRLRLRPLTFLHHPGVQPFLNQPEDAAVRDAMLHELDNPAFVDSIEESLNVSVHNVVHFLPYQRVRQRVQRLMLATPRAKPVREAQKVLLIDRIEDGDHAVLDNLV